MSKAKHTEESLFIRTIPEVASLLKLSIGQVYTAESKALKRIKDAMTNPVITYTVAHEVSDVEIGRLFKENPWCCYVKLWDGTMIPRGMWFEQLTKIKETSK